MIAPVALPVTIVEYSLRIKIINHHQVKVPTWMTLESGMILLENGMMVIGRYCAAFTDMGRVTYIFFFILSIENSNDGGIEGGDDGGGKGRGVTCGRQNK